jgi:hypothetical protein
MTACHLYAGKDNLPDTSAPGQLGNTVTGLYTQTYTFNTPVCYPGRHWGDITGSSPPWHCAASGEGLRGSDCRPSRVRRARAPHHTAPHTIGCSCCFAPPPSLPSPLPGCPLGCASAAVADSSGVRRDAHPVLGGPRRLGGQPRGARPVVLGEGDGHGQRQLGHVLPAAAGLQLQYVGGFTMARGLAYSGFVVRPLYSFLILSCDDGWGS